MTARCLVSTWPANLRSADEREARCRCCGEPYDEPIFGLSRGKGLCLSCEYDLLEEARAPRRRGHLIEL